MERHAQFPSDPTYTSTLSHHIKASPSHTHSAEEESTAPKPELRLESNYGVFKGNPGTFARGLWVFCTLTLSIPMHVQFKLSILRLLYSLVSEKYSFVFLSDDVLWRNME